MSKGSDIVKGIYDAFGKGDVGTVLGAFDPKIEWNEAEGFPYADGNPYIGPDKIAEGIFGRITSDVDGFAVTPQRFIDGGDLVAVEGRYTGTWGATGTKVDTQFCHIWTLGGGKVKGFQQYTDTKQWAEAAAT
jgi:hypothetical protein